MSKIEVAGFAAYLVDFRWKMLFTDPDSVLNQCEFCLWNSRGNFLMFFVIQMSPENISQPRNIKDLSEESSHHIIYIIIMSKDMNTFWLHSFKQNKQHILTEEYMVTLLVIIIREYNVCFHKMF